MPFGVFLCLDCAGVHRGLGVHISLVSSNASSLGPPAGVAETVADLCLSNRARSPWLDKDVTTACLE